MLTNKKVVILGGSSGIGLATAKAAAAAGAHVVIVSSNQARIDEALKGLPGKPEGYAIDLSKEANIKAFFERVGPFDHLVYTAGDTLSLVTLEQLVMDEARAFFDIRYWGAVTAVKYGSPHIRPGGSVCLIGGTASPRPGKGWSLAASICAAMEGFTRAMAVELAPMRVNLVEPGVIRTNLWNGLPADVREGMYATEASRLPVRRVGEAEDIARTFIYLMEEPHITGQAIVVDGGSVLV
ncbi:SDR family oxidoreductase [Puia dinghuensis]|nr:SDR family oxidoreductase [Puia dinghuensis]